MKIETKRGCDSCKHRGISETCNLGNSVACAMWWSVNGKKSLQDEVTPMDCYEQSQILNSLDRMSNMLDEMLAILNKEKSENKF